MTVLSAEGLKEGNKEAIRPSVSTVVEFSSMLWQNAGKTGSMQSMAEPVLNSNRSLEMKTLLEAVVRMVVSCGILTPCPYRRENSLISATTTARGEKVQIQRQSVPP